MQVIWLFMSFSLNSETPSRISKPWFRSRIFFSFSFESSHNRIISWKLSVIILSFEKWKESGSVFVKIGPETSKFSTSWSKLRKNCPYSELFWSVFFSHFSTFGLNTERYSVSLRIQSESVNLHQNNSEYGHFLRSANVSYTSSLCFSSFCNCC